jgi:2-oxoisovalerate dehydrogenase E1 component
MMHSCVEAAAAAGIVCVFLEPIALYHTRDLHTDGDDGWLARYPDLTAEPHAPIGRARVYGDGTDLTLVAFGNGLRMSLRVAQRLDRIGISSRTVDLRWLAPLPIDDLIREANATGKVLIVDETRKNGGVGEGILAALLEYGFTGGLDRVASADSFIPLGDAALEVLLSEDAIEAAAMKLVGSA